MEQVTMLSQYDIDKGDFIKLVSKFTGISKSKLADFLQTNPINTLFEHPMALQNISEGQLQKIIQLRDLKNLYYNLKSYETDYVINSTAKAGEYFKNYLYGLKDKEVFSCCFLDTQNRAIITKNLFTGTINESAVYPREIAKEALRYDAASVILAHNHPGGSIRPSSADLHVTKRIAEALGTLNIKIMDHIIVGNDRYCSFAEEGYDLTPGVSTGINQTNEITRNLSVKDKIIEQYINEFSAIKYISDKTANAIDDLNKHGTPLTIQDIKDRHIEFGNKNDMDNFLPLNEIVEDLKFAQLTERRISAQNKAVENISEMESVSNLELA